MANQKKTLDPGVKNTERESLVDFNKPYDTYCFIYN